MTTALPTSGDLRTMAFSGISIHEVLCTQTFGGFYYEDITSLHEKSVPEEDRYVTRSQQEGFRYLREIAETLSVGLVHDHHVAWGDCVGVAHGGKAGRRHVLRHGPAKKIVEEVVAPWLKRVPISSLKAFDRDWKAFEFGQRDDFDPALTYGLTQAVLGLLAAFMGSPKALFRVIAKEWDLPQTDLEVLPLQGSLGNNRIENAEKMIIRRLAALPHSRVDDIESQLGLEGEKLLAYVQWLKEHIRRVDDPTYTPTVHLDVHGAVGRIFNQKVDQIVDYLMLLQDTLGPLPLRMESVALADSVDDQIEIYSQIKNELVRRQSPVKLVADEWANNLQDIQKFVDRGCVDMVHVKCPDVGSVADIVNSILYCKQGGISVLLGGSSIETAISTRATMHIAMVTRPDVVLMKPGMGVDEAYMICQGEMARIAAESRLAVPVQGE